MSSDVPIGDLVEHAIGGGWGSDVPDNDSTEVAIIRGADFPTFKTDPASVPRRFEKTSKVPQRTLNDGDILLEISGGTKDRSTGRTVYVSQEDLDQWGTPVIPASFCRLVRINQAKAHPRYVYYWLQQMHSSGRAWLYQNQSTGLSNFQFKHFLDAELVRLPTLEEQRAIAEVLGALDDRIEVLARIARTTDELRQSLFNELVLNDRDRESWPNVRLSKLCTTQYGFTASASDEPVGPHFVRVTDINKHPWVEWAVTPYAEVPADKLPKYRLYAGDILVARMADPGKSTLIDSDVDAVFASYLVRLATDSQEMAHYIYGFLQSPEYADYANGAQSGSVQKNMNARVIVGCKIPIAPKEIVSRYAATAAVMRARMSAAIEESRSVANLRDALLPRLLSGQLRVDDPKRLLESAA